MRLKHCVSVSAWMHLLQVYRCSAAARFLQCNTSFSDCKILIYVITNCICNKLPLLCSEEQAAHKSLFCWATTDTISFSFSRQTLPTLPQGLLSFMCQKDVRTLLVVTKVWRRRWLMLTFTHQTVCILHTFLPHVRAINEPLSQSDTALHPVQEVTSR